MIMVMIMVMNIIMNMSMNMIMIIEYNLYIKMFFSKKGSYQ